MADTFVEERQGDTWINAVIGGVAIFGASTVMGSVIPLVGQFGGGVCGGLLAGYLQDTTRNDGAKVGALAGAISLVPMLMLLPLAAVFFGIGFLDLLNSGSGGFGLFLVGLFAVLFVVSAAAMTISGAIGGYLGVAMAEDARDRRPAAGERPPRRSRGDSAQWEHDRRDGREPDGRAGRGPARDRPPAEDPDPRGRTREEGRSGDSRHRRDEGSEHRRDEGSDPWGRTGEESSGGDSGRDRDPEADPWERDESQ